MVLVKLFPHASYIIPNTPYLIHHTLYLIPHTLYIMRPTQITDQLIQEFIVAGLHEDVRDGDHTSLATIPADSRSRAVLKIKDYGVLAGVELAQYIFRHLDPTASISVQKPDGTDVLYGQTSFEVESNTRALSARCSATPNRVPAITPATAG